MLKTKYPPAVCPFKPDQAVTLNSGERGKVYEDGWGNTAYLHDDGIVYVWFLPSRARSLDSVVRVPLSQFISN